MAERRTCFFLQVNEREREREERERDRNRERQTERERGTERINFYRLKKA